MRTPIACACLLLAVGCGPKYVHRPLLVEVQGLSRMAESLVLAVFPKSSGTECDDVTVATVQMLEAPFSARWMRTDAMTRELSIPEIDEEDVTVVVYTENAAGDVIQLACSDVSYKEIEEGRIGLRLPAATASIIRPWRRSSDPSSSSDSLVAAAWRRSSSRAVAETRSRSRSS